MIKPKEKKIKKRREIECFDSLTVKDYKLICRRCFWYLIKRKNLSNFYNLSKPRSSLSHVGCTRDANIFPSYNQFLTLESLTRPVHLGFLITLNQILDGDPQINKQTNKNHHQRCTGTCDTYCYLINVCVNSGLTQPVRPTLDSLVKTHHVSLERPWLILLEVRV